MIQKLYQYNCPGILYVFNLCDWNYYNSKVTITYTVILHAQYSLQNYKSRLKKIVLDFESSDFGNQLIFIF